jgi:hypothetical protein
MEYVPQAVVPETRAALANYHRVRAIVAEICEITRELLRRREVL